jgi:DNA replication protein
MSNESGNDGSPVTIPDEFFAQVLPRIRDLAELKVVLHVFQVGARLGTPAVPLTELLRPNIVQSVVGDQSPEAATDRLHRIVERAVSNGALLRLTVTTTEKSETLLAPGTSSNRDLMERIGVDDESVSRLRLPPEFQASLYRPNVFAFYERHVGPLTPIVSEQLREAERSYPREWIEQAILEAEHYKRRSWRYIETILAQWEQSGAPEGASRPPA